MPHSPSASLRHCLAHGEGSWIFKNITSPPYTLGTSVSYRGSEAKTGSFMPGWADSKWYWGCEGKCCKKGCATCYPHPDTALRPELMYEWAPAGPHCDAGLPSRSADGRLPPTSALSAKFCEHYAGRSFLFVGDSIQGQFFSSFVHQVGYIRAVYNNTVNDCCKYMYSGGAHECDVTAILCTDEPQTRVRVRFLRNAYLYLNPATNAAGRHLGNPNCDWIDEARDEQTTLVLASGMHVRAGVEGIADRLNKTLYELEDLVPDGALKLRHRLIYRSIHAPMYNCSKLKDPMSPAEAASYGEEVVAMDPTLDRYNWSRFALMETLAKAALKPANVPYLDVYRATSMRPGGYNLLRPRGSRSAVIDCGHYCMPGPLDEWGRLLLLMLLHGRD